jgi:hypothetical protein
LAMDLGGAFRFFGKFPPQDDQHSWDLIRHRMSRYYVSAIVESEDNPPFPETDADKAFSLVELLSNQFGLADRAELLRRVERQVEKLLREQWSKVDELAQSLIRQQSHSLTYAEVCELLAVDPSCPVTAFMSFAEQLSGWKLNPS